MQTIMLFDPVTPKWLAINQIIRRFDVVVTVLHFETLCEIVLELFTLFTLSRATFVSPSTE